MDFEADDDLPVAGRAADELGGLGLNGHRGPFVICEIRIASMDYKEVLLI